MKATIGHSPMFLTLDPNDLGGDGGFEIRGNIYYIYIWA